MKKPNPFAKAAKPGKAPAPGKGGKPAMPPFPPGGGKGKPFMKGGKVKGC